MHVLCSSADTFEVAIRILGIIEEMFGFSLDELADPIDNGVVVAAEGANAIHNGH